MKYKILIMLFALILLPFGGQGQRVLNDKETVSILAESVLINQPGTYTITGNSTKTNNTIKIECESNDLVTLRIDKLNIEFDTNVKNSPIDIVKGNVRLQLIGENRIISNASYAPNFAAIHVPTNSSLTISDVAKGSLIIQVESGGAGIGGNASDRFNTVGNITIESGTIEVTNLSYMSAIGGGFRGQGISNITINGGHIIAKAYIANNLSTAIGGATGPNGYNANGGTIKINGGTLITLNTYNGIGSIGHSTNKPLAKVIIGDKASVFFNPGLSNVKPVNNRDEEVYLKTIRGLKPKSKVALLNNSYTIDLFADDNGKLYFWWPSGHEELDYIHTYDESVPDDSELRNFHYYRQSLTVNKNGTSWDDHGITFTVKKDNAGDAINCSDNDFYLVKGEYTLYADGNDINKPINIAGTKPDYITNNIILDYYTVTYDLNNGDNNPSIPKPTNYLKGKKITVDNTVIPTRKYYEFKGWGKNIDSDENNTVNEITSIDKEEVLYAIWKPNEFSVNTVGRPQELTYKKDMSLDLSSLLGPTAETKCGAITFNIDNGSSLPAGLQLDGSTIKGAPEAVTTDITTYITATAANTFSCKFDIKFSVAKANATIAKIEIPTEGYTYSGKAIEIAPPEVSGAASEKMDATLTYYTSYTNENNNTKTTSANSGAYKEGGAPIYAGSYTVIASFAGNENYNKADNQSAKFDIKRKELTVTPVSNQIIYEGDEILYEVKDAVNGEMPVFDGALKVKEGIIIQDNDFKLKDSFSKNYSFKFTPDIGVTVHEGKASEAVATMKAEAGQNDWFTSNVTITPPADFKIELVSSKPLATLKSNEAHKETLLWDTEGAHTLSYTLHRQSRSESYDHDLPLKLDKTPPTLRATVDNENYTLTFSDSDAGSGIAKLLVDDQEVSISDTDASYAGTAPAGKHKALVFDKAGLSYEIEFTLTKKPDNPDPNPGPDPGPDPGPKPTPTRYDVTLTDTTGVIFTPAAGKYKVDAWGKFDFSIEVAKGYTMFSDPIVYVNNVKLPSKDSKGNYTINPVREDKVVKVTGIVSDLSTANEAINAPDRRITVIGKTIYVDVPDRALFHLFDLTGSHKLSRQLHPGTNRIDVEPGSYIARIDNEKEGRVIIVK